MRPAKALGRLAPILVLLAAAPANAAAPAHGKPAHPLTTREDQRLRTVLHAETRWLEAKTAKDLAPIIAPSFVHPTATGALLGRAGYLQWFAHRHRIPKARQAVSGLQIRLIRPKVAVATGRVSVYDAHKHLARRWVFTDVFDLEHGRWKAVSAQETPVPIRHRARRHHRPRKHH